MERFRSALDDARPVLWATALLGLVVLNTVYLYASVTDPSATRDALANPVAAVFMIEAVVLMALAAWVIRRAGLERPGWLAFVGLSLLGTLAFSVPAFILLHLRRRPAEHEERPQTVGTRVE